MEAPEDGQVLFVVGDFARIVLDGIFGFIGNGLGGALAAEFGMGGFLGTVAVIETVAHTVVVNPVRVAPTAPHLIENIAPVFLAFLFAVLIVGQGLLLLDIQRWISMRVLNRSFSAPQRLPRRK
jgi:hypothetical protein